MINPKTTYALADYIPSMNRARIRSMRSARTNKTWIGIRITHLLHQQGVLLSHKVEDKYIHVYFKFKNSRHIISNSQTISKPSLRYQRTLKQLVKETNVTNSTGSFIISTQKGLFTSDYCLIQGHICGEILVKVNL
jgi:ribosomal protein S8